MKENFLDLPNTATQAATAGISSPQQPPHRARVARSKKEAKFCLKQFQKGLVKKMKKGQLYTEIFLKYHNKIVKVSKILKFLLLFL